MKYTQSFRKGMEIMEKVDPKVSKTVKRSEILILFLPKHIKPPT